MHGFCVEFFDDFMSFSFSYDSMRNFYGLMSLYSAGDMGKSASFTDKRALWLRKRGMDILSLRCVRQVHGKEIVDASSFFPGREPSADGLFCTDASLVCGVTVADCMPVWIFREDGTAWGIVHSGWKGTGIAGILADSLGDGKKVAVLGPSIRSCCYEVDTERAWSFAADFGEEAVVEREDGFYLDLAAANRSLLEERGLTVYTVDACTCCDMRFGSYRREGPDFTHMLALCGRA
ncbi:polyphenol oxidase family protein [Spirochaetia bacterium 38H-sp]|uniref:Polyphenol oxidase family protein n=1 Tax=Rarispira pelagica TaxID=3141764 RepID=A0ABU9UCX9_9SPIR